MVCTRRLRLVVVATLCDMGLHRIVGVGRCLEGLVNDALDDVILMSDGEDKVDVYTVTSGG
jgi:hypothetical protein